MSEALVVERLDPFTLKGTGQILALNKDSSLHPGSERRQLPASRLLINTVFSIPSLNKDSFLLQVGGNCRGQRDVGGPGGRTLQGRIPGPPSSNVLS